MKAGDVGFSAHDTGWKVTAGLRPIDLLGVEVSYVDFGKPTRDIGAVRVDSDTMGAGAQAHRGSFAVRAEYERFETDQGKPNLLSLGVTWTFP